jgi:phosphoribosylanthranilate isomerase
MWIKICGIRDEATARAVAACAPDAIGLNFFAGSPRVVSVETAVAIVSHLPSSVEPIGVFVNHNVAEIRQTARVCNLKTIQLHGDEPPEMLAELAPLRVIRAFRVGPAGLGELAAYLERCRELGTPPYACLIDARVPGAYGGTGETPPWDIVRREYRTAVWPPLVLAGGLMPVNVGAGGVESAVACKDAALVRKFVENARRASQK